MTKPSPKRSWFTLPRVHSTPLRYLKRSNLPVAAMAGNRFTVSTAIFTDSVYPGKLPSVELKLRPCDFR